MGKRRQRVSADWVFRPNIRLADGTIIDDLGTYDPLQGTLVAGAANANFHVLYDSHNRWAAVQSLGLAPGLSLMPNAARAEASRPLILRVRGMMTLRPSVWAVGNAISVAIRFGIYEQDPSAGSVLIDPAYTLMSQGLAGVNQLRPATWANDRNWQHEKRLVFSFGDNATHWARYFNFRVNRRLDPNEAYGIFMESDAGNWVSSQTLLYQMWFSTLVADEG